MTKQHRLKNVDKDKMNATCSQCGEGTEVRKHGDRYRCAVKVIEKSRALVSSRRETKVQRPREGVPAYHRLTNVDRDIGVATCSVCGPDSAVRVYAKRTLCDVGVYETSKRQEANRKERQSRIRYSWRIVVSDRLMKGECERCSFIAEDQCQLDVDHIVRRADGGSDNPENLQVLCANCHRLKSRAEKIGVPHTTSRSRTESR